MTEKKKKRGFSFWSGKPEEKQTEAVPEEKVEEKQPEHFLDESEDIVNIEDIEFAVNIEDAVYTENIVDTDNTVVETGGPSGALGDAPTSPLNTADTENIEYKENTVYTENISSVVEHSKKKRLNKRKTWAARLYRHPPELEEKLERASYWWRMDKQEIINVALEELLKGKKLKPVPQDKKPWEE